MWKASTRRSETSTKARRTGRNLIVASCASSKIIYREHRSPRHPERESVAKGSNSACRVAV